MCILNPRAPKIRHLNASHTLLIEMGKHLQKVQELEIRVYEMEMELQLKELVKSHEIINKVWEREKEAAKRRRPDPVALEAEKAFTDRLTEARRKSELLTAKRAEEEAYVMRKYQCGRLKNAIDKMSEIPEGEASILLLPEPPKQVEDTETKLMLSLERLVESVQNPGETPKESIRVEIAKLKELVNEKESLRNMMEQAKEKEDSASNTYEECLVTLNNLSASRSRFSASLKMSDQTASIMDNVTKKRNSGNIFVFGPNPIFSAIKEEEISYAITNHFSIETLKELDLSSIVAERNLESAAECLKKSKENRIQVESALLLTKESLDLQMARVHEAKDIVDQEALEVIKSVEEKEIGMEISNIKANVEENSGGKRMRVSSPTRV